MGKCVRALALASAAFAALAQAIAVPAQAGVMDCIETVAPPEVEKAVEDAAKTAQCVGQAASGDAAMIAAIGVITALRAGGAFSNTEQCMGLIDSTIGKQVAKALLATPAADTPLFSPVKSQLQAIANGDSSVSFTDLASKFLPLEKLLSYMTCGCQIAGLDNEVDKLVNAYADHVTGCAAFLTDAAAFAGEAIESGIDAVGEGIKKVVEFAEKCLTDLCGLFDDDDGSECVTHVFPENKFGSLVPYDIKTVGSCGDWVCAQGGHPQTHVIEGKTWQTCSYCYGVWAKDGNGQCAPCGGAIGKKISADNICLTVTTGYPDYSGAHCTVTESAPTCCAPGQIMKPVGWTGQVNCDGKGVIGGECINVENAKAQCAAACLAPKYFDTVTGQCTSCAPDSVPVYESNPQVSSIAQCKQCPLGLSGEHNLTCQPCGPGELIWSLSPPKKLKPGGLDTQKQAGPVGGTSKKQDGSTTGATAPAPSEAVAKLPTPKAGPQLNTEAEMPGGPILGLAAGGRCTACPENWFPVYYYDAQQNSLGYCKECPSGTHLDVPKQSQVLKDPVTGEQLIKTPEPKCVPLDCPAGVDPKDIHACLPPNVAKPVVPVVPVVPGGPALRPCPPGRRLVDGACRPPSSSLVPGKRLVCPPGQIRNAAGTACIRIGKGPSSVRDLSKRPSPSTTTTGKRRPAEWLLKRRTGPTPTPIPIPIPR